MNIKNNPNDLVILEDFGRKIGRHRLDLNLTQAMLAEQAGVSKRTVERVEAGGSVQLTSLVRILRVLDLLDAFLGLVPQSPVSPMELLKMKGKERKRASFSREPLSSDEVREKEAWTWGDVP